MQKKTVPLILVTAVAVFLVLSFTLPAEAANWQQVTTISGSDSQTTSEFMVSGSEWRIRWSYTPDAQFPSLTAFSFFVYPHGETAAYVGHVVEYGSSETSGTLDFHDGPGLHYVEVLAANTQGYTLNVEYDTQSVMSDSLIAVIVGLVIGIPIVLIVIISFMVRRRVKRRKLLTASPPPPPPP
jgi:hypothetical protein